MQAFDSAPAQAEPTLAAAAQELDVELQAAIEDRGAATQMLEASPQARTAFFAQEWRSMKSGQLSPTLGCLALVLPAGCRIPFLLAWMGRERTKEVC
jgi:hypothetical protein